MMINMVNRCPDDLEHARLVFDFSGRPLPAIQDLMTQLFDWEKLGNALSKKKLSRNIELRLLDEDLRATTRHKVEEFQWIGVTDKMNALLGRTPSVTSK